MKAVCLFGKGRPTVLILRYLVLSCGYVTAWGFDLQCTIAVNELHLFTDRRGVRCARVLWLHEILVPLAFWFSAGKLPHWLWSLRRIACKMTLVLDAFLAHTV